MLLFDSSHQAVCLISANKFKNSPFNISRVKAVKRDEIRAKPENMMHEENIKMQYLS